MLKYIEFIAAPGSGKTTLLNSLINSRLSDETWLTEADAIKKVGYEFVSKKPIVKMVPTYLLLHVPVVYSYTLRNVLKKEKNRLDEAVWVNSRWNPLLQYCLESGRFQELKEKSPIMAVKYLNWVRETIIHISLLNQYAGNTAVVYDQALIQVLRMFVTAEDSADYLSEALQKIPQPLGFIYLKADVDTVIERRMKRNSERDQRSLRQTDKATRERIEKEIAGLEVITMALQKSNIPVLTLDAKEEMNLNQAHEFIAKNSNTLNKI